MGPNGLCKWMLLHLPLSSQTLVAHSEVTGYVKLLD